MDMADRPQPEPPKAERPQVSHEASVRIGVAIADAIWRSVYGRRLPVRAD